MVEQEYLSRRERGPGPREPNGSPSRFTVVPFTRTEPMVLIKTIDNRTPGPDKNDLDTNDPPIPPLTEKQRAIVERFSSSNTTLLELNMVTELLLLAHDLGTQMFSLFRFNPSPGRAIEFPPGSTLAHNVEISADFKKMHDAIHLEFETALMKQAAAGKVDVNALEATTPGSGRFGRPIRFNPRGVKTTVDFEISTLNVALRAVIGGSFQGGHAALKEFTADPVKKTYRAKLQYVLLDHFGVDNSDVEGPLPHGSAGQVSFWVLQHQRGPGFNPYITTVIIERTLSGDLK